MPSMTSLEAVLPQTGASISFDAKPEFGRSAESTEGANGVATETGMAALLGMWTMIFQQQVLPESIAAEAGSEWQGGASSEVSETQTTASGGTQESSHGGKGSPVSAADILRIVGGQSVQASTFWQRVPEAVEANAIKPTPIEPEAKALASPAFYPGLSQPDLPVVSSDIEAIETNTPVVETTKTELPVPVAMAVPLKKEADTKASGLTLVIAAFEPMPSISAPQKSKSSDTTPESTVGEKVVTTNPAPTPADAKLVPAVGPPPMETVVNLKRKVSERILPKAPSVEVQPAVHESIEEPPKIEPASKLNLQPELTKPAATTELTESVVESESLAIEEPKLAQEPTVPDSAPRREDSVLKAASDGPAPAPAPHALEPAARAATGTTPPQAPPPTPAAQRTKAAFVPEPPPAPLVSREAKTISIRIPLNDSSAATGTPVRHLDLIFNQRNNDLTLQFNSPNTEIQGRIEESMPSLLNKLQTENWAARPAELAAGAAQPDLGLDGRRRADSILPSANQFDSLREPVATASASTQGFNFDDSPADRENAQDQSQQGRSRKKERAWQDEFDEQLEP